MKAINNFLLTFFVLATAITVMPLASYAQERIIYQAYVDGDNEIYTMKTDGSNQLPLTNNADFDGEPSIAGNGTKVTFTSTRDGNAEIYSMNPDGTDQKRLTNNLGSDAHPVFNHDATKIAFISNRDGSANELYIMNADGTEQTRVTFAPYGVFSPDFHPDGTKVVYQRYDGNDVDIFMINVDGSNEVNITDNTADDRDPSFSPDGTKIAYQVEVSTYWDIFVMNADGTDQVNITTSNNINDTQPDFSPDGNHISFASHGDIWLMTRGGEGGVNLTEPTDSTGFPQWSPANHAPVLENVIIDQQVNEGSVAKITGVIADEDAADSFGMTVDWGEGGPEFHVFPAGTTTFELTHTYVDDLPTAAPSDDYTVNLSVNDHRWGFGSASKTVTVQNVNPEISNLTLTPSSPATVGTALRLRGNFNDAGYHGSVSDEGLVVTIAFGDGQTNVSNPVAPGVIDIFHTYPAIGSYTITVKVTDNDQGETITTIPVNVVPPAAPAAPTSLRIDYIAANRIQIAWVDGSNSEDGFVIERCANKNCANFAQVGQVGPNTTTYVDNNLFTNTQYYYRVRAYNLGGSSEYSNVVSAKTLKK